MPSIGATQEMQEKSVSDVGQDRVIIKVLGASIDALDWSDAIGRITNWAARRESRYVCICNAHSVVTATQDSKFAEIIDQADMATPDGAPVAWMMRRLGMRAQVRINGPELMLRYMAAAAHRNESVFLYGSTSQTLAMLQQQLLQRFPTLQIAGSYAPPFRPLTEEEDAAAVKLINDSGAGTVWVSLGCPKQERWMAEHRGKIEGVMLGVGAAFEFHAGTIRRAPNWMQQRGLEWLHRLLCEPRRLWRRYLLTNTAFVLGASRQLIERVR